MTSLTVATSRGDARRRLLAELATGPAQARFPVSPTFLGNRAEAEEAVQEALARACEIIADLRDPAAAPAWFLRIVTSMCLRTLRRRRLRRTLFGWLDRASDDASASPEGDRSGDVRSSTPPWRSAAATARSPTASTHRAARSLDDLPAKQRAALVLRYGHDLSVPEVAEMLGVEHATAKTHLVRGLARLRDLMEEHR